MVQALFSGVCLKSVQVSAVQLRAAHSYSGWVFRWGWFRFAGLLFWWHAFLACLIASLLAGFLAHLLDGFLPCSLACWLALKTRQIGCPIRARGEQPSTFAPKKRVPIAVLCCRPRNSQSVETGGLQETWFAFAAACLQQSVTIWKVLAKVAAGYLSKLSAKNSSKRWRWLTRQHRRNRTPQATSVASTTSYETRQPVRFSSRVVHFRHKEELGRPSTAIECVKPGIGSSKTSFQGGLRLPSRNLPNCWSKKLKLAGSSDFCSLQAISLRRKYNVPEKSCHPKDMGQSTFMSLCKCAN